MTKKPPFVFPTQKQQKPWVKDTKEKTNQFLLLLSSELLENVLSVGNHGFPDILKSAKGNRLIQ